MRVLFLYFSGDIKFSLRVNNISDEFPLTDALLQERKGLFVKIASGLGCCIPHCQRHGLLQKTLKVNDIGGCNIISESKLPYQDIQPSWIFRESLNKVIVYYLNEKELMKKQSYLKGLKANDYELIMLQVLKCTTLQTIRRNSYAGTSYHVESPTVIYSLKMREIIFHYSKD